MSFAASLFAGVPTLVKGSTTIGVTEALENVDVIGLYFSAHWCPPCRGFTPELASVYKELKSSNASLEIVFLSSDRDEASFQEYYNEMPWLALPHSHADIKSKLSDEYGCEGIPHLVFIDGKTGLEITREGREVIDKFGAKGFPFTASHLEEQAAAKLAVIGAAFTNWTVFGDQVDPAALRSKEAVAVFVGNGRSQATYVSPKLAQAYAKLEDQLAVVYLPFDVEDAAAEAEFQAAMPAAWIKLTNTDSIIAGLASTIGTLESPTVFIVSGDSTRLLAEDASRIIYENVDAGFPWSPAAVAAANEAAQAKVEAFKTQLSGGGLKFLAEARVVQKGRAEPVAVAELLENDLVGLYFSAHWCGPCRKFTPALTAVYKELKALGKKAEILFVSSDRDQESFNSYFEDMPWLALDYAERDLKDLLSSAMDVSGIPTLIWLDPATGAIYEKGREFVAVGAKYFPWTPELMAQGVAEAKAKAAADMVAANERAKAVEQGFRAAGTVVVKDYRGKGIISGDYTLQFDNFNTFVADVQLKNGKFYYEVEILKLSNIAQIGWHTLGFPASERGQGMGVGDDAYSWGFDGVRQLRWGNGDTPFGSTWSQGDILGCAADLQTKTISFSVNGSFAEPNGTAFSDIVMASDWIAPALSANEDTYRVNFGQLPFKFAPPSPSYQSVHEAQSH